MNKKDPPAKTAKSMLNYDFTYIVNINFYYFLHGYRSIQKCAMYVGWPLQCNFCLFIFNTEQKSSRVT